MKQEAWRRRIGLVCGPLRTWALSPSCSQVAFSAAHPYSGQEEDDSQRPKNICLLVWALMTTEKEELKSLMIRTMLQATSCKGCWDMAIGNPWGWAGEEEAGKGRRMAASSAWTLSPAVLCALCCFPRTSFALREESSGWWKESGGKITYLGNAYLPDTAHT